jgi:hypothetical protein
LVLGDQLRLEGAASIPRNLQVYLAGIGDDGLLAVAVAVVGGRSPVGSRRRTRLILQVLVQLGVEHPLGERLLDLIQ